MSRVVRDQVRDKLDVTFEDMGEQQVKNIARPVHAYRITVAENAAAKGPLPLPEKPSLVVLPFQNMTGDVEQEYSSTASWRRSLRRSRGCTGSL